ncbi:oxidoreductase [Neoasaia chiangmaiensis NBRC 101099]|uniref:Dehydrogenase n=1 Tax=Neoasaia chiangmaiensis TaxID=320497 RepID=A0A1U9KRJ7_9PROT|nr:SDR family NAD(P)-dependent oxidoreductase [Neoasaia chiangmaiensis]AQS88300.1 dehydrogenase [Neoasaia chiangmaiensis]GBR39611.1 oxidoreductase [Neoasaia chiangmaiensis NBRC 101099]GEN14664.1 short-chain dehydrogenase [Neoasaia chiangmaiensis]
MTTKTVLITGASSGIGRGIALATARSGVVLHLGGRDAARLKAVADECSRRGATACWRSQDVTDRSGMADWLAEAGRDRLDMVYACAGVTGGARAPDVDGAAWEPAAQVRRMFAVDLDGALNTILPALEIMRAQPRDAEGVRGRICAIASVAGLVSYPGTASYSAAKGALDRFVIASGAYARRAGIHLTSVCCGFVDTPMVAQNRFPMPGLVSTSHAVRKILRGVARGQRRVVFPAWLVMGSRLMDMLPITLAQYYYLRQGTGRPGSLTALDDRD